jgi:hypothetical protein
MLHLLLATLILRPFLMSGPRLRDKLLEGSVRRVDLQVAQILSLERLVEGLEQVVWLGWALAALRDNPPMVDVAVGLG